MVILPLNYKINSPFKPRTTLAISLLGDAEWTNLLFTLPPTRINKQMTRYQRERRFDSASAHWRQLGSFIHGLEVSNNGIWQPASGGWEAGTSGPSGPWTRLIEEWLVWRWELPHFPDPLWRDHIQDTIRSSERQSLTLNQDKASTEAGLSLWGPVLWKRELTFSEGE